MPNHSSATKISKLLRKLREEQASRKTRWQKLHGDEAPVDYTSRRGLLLCYSSQDYLNRRLKRVSAEKLKQFDKLQAAIGLIPSMEIVPALPGKKTNLSSKKQHKIKQVTLRVWKNFDLNAYAVLKALLKQNKFLATDLMGKIEDSPFSPASLIPQNPDPCLGVYMEHLVKFLYSKNLPRQIRNTGKDLLNCLQKKLFEKTQLTTNEKALFLEIYQLSWVKRSDPYSYKRRNARKSAHPIDEARAAAIIEWLIKEIISTKSLGAVSTLLYIWISLQAAFSEITTSVNEILQISDSLNIRTNPAEKLPLIKAGVIHLSEGKLPLPNRLLHIVGAAIDNRSKKPIFQVDPSTIENYLQRANEAMGFDNKKDPIALETFLHRPLP